MQLHQIAKLTILLLAGATSATALAQGKPTKAPSLSPLGIYDSAGSLAARVLNGTSAIITNGDRHYITSVSGQGATLRLGSQYRVLFQTVNCTGQAWHPIASVNGTDYLSQGGYIIDFRPDGSYLTPVNTANTLSGLQVYSELAFDNAGTEVCTGGVGAPGFPRTYTAIEVEQAGTAVKVTGPGPYTVR